MKTTTRQHHPSWKKEEALRMWRVSEAFGLKATKTEIARYLRVNPSTLSQWINEHPLSQPPARRFWWPGRLHWKRGRMPKGKLGIRLMAMINDHNSNMPRRNILKKYGIVDSTLDYHLEREEQRKPGSIRWRRIANKRTKGESI